MNSIDGVIHTILKSNQSLFTLIFSFISQPAQYALLLACFSKDNRCYCIVREMQVININSEPIRNDFKCPLFFMTSTINTIEPLSVTTCVSIIHECTDTCLFAETTSTHRVERENTEKRQLTFKHDYTNNCYCLNIYCMNQ